MYYLPHISVTLILSCLERHRATVEGFLSEPNDLQFLTDHRDFVTFAIVMIRLRAQS